MLAECSDFYFASLKMLLCLIFLIIREDVKNKAYVCMYILSYTALLLALVGCGLSHAYNIIILHVYVCTYV